MQIVPSLTRVNRIDFGEIGRLQEVCDGGSGCLLGDALGGLVVLFCTGVVTAALVLTLVNLGDALRRTREERARTVAERDAFAAFARRIAALDPTSSGPVTRRDGGPLFAADRTGRSSYVPDVEPAYRETVMDVDHYDEEYGEPFGTHLAAEFGTGVDRALRKTDGLTPQLQSVLVTNARTASDLRDDLVDAIDDERDDLAAVRRGFERIDERLVSMAERPITDRSYDELRRTWLRLDDLEAECENVVTARQTTVRGDSFTPGLGDDGPETLQEYLYEPLSVSYPVLADGARVVDRIRTAKRRVFDAIAVGPGVNTTRS